MAEPLSLYIHWPFCQSKCPYCDFNSHVRDRVDQQQWRNALLAELAAIAGRIGERRLVSMFFGGGTPSLMDPDSVAALIDAAIGHWPGDDRLEITLEANPSSVEAANFAALKAAGVNRLSLGVQSLNDQALRFLGRRHDAAEALKAIEIAGKYFKRFSFDLIYALPEQNLNSWRDELRRALGMAGGHLSLYQLTIEPGTAFFEQVRRRRFAIPDEDDGADLFALTQQMMADAGMPAYEISNHARQGEACRHNVAIWQGGEYAGIGPGAHGRLRVGGGWQASVAVKKPEAWLDQVTATGDGQAWTAIDDLERERENLLTGLRLRDGVATKAADPRAIAELVGLGLIVEDGDHIRLSPEGWPLLDAILEKLL